MATKTNRVHLRLALCIISLHAHICWSLLDFEELSNVNYGIDILNVPIVVGQELTPGSVLLTTKYGQQYHCGYPDKSVEEKKTREEEKEAEEIGIPELLSPMKDSPCLILTKDWWTYEFCFGKVVKQYHIEDGKIMGNLVHLGYYQSEFDWSSEDKPNTNKKRNQLIRYHSQQYVNGTLCDLTGNPRTVEVRFQCESGAGDYIARIDEPETCVYILTVHTMKICHHPYLKPASPNKPLPISCNPVLTAAQYQEYLEEQEVERKAKEEAARLKNLQKAESIRAFREQQEIQKSLTEGETQEPDTGNAASEHAENADVSADSLNVNAKKYNADGDLEKSVQSLEKLMINSLSKGLQDLVKENEDGNNPNVNLDVKVIKDPKELRKYMNELLTAKEKDADTEAEAEDSAESKGQEKSTETADGQTDSQTTTTTETTDAETDSQATTTAKITDTQTGSQTTTTKPEDDKETNEEFTEAQVDERKTKTIDTVQDAHAGRTDTQTATQDNDRGAAIETAEHSSTDTDPLDAETDQEALQEFDKGLEKLDKERISKLNKFKDTIESAVQSKFNDIIQEAQDELQQDGLNDEINKPEAYKRLAKTLNKLLKKLDDTGKEMKKMDEQLIDKLNRVKADKITDSVTSPDETSPTDSHKNTEDVLEEKDSDKPTEKRETSRAKIRVRIAKVRQRKEDSSGDDTASSKQSLRIPQEQKQKLEDSVRSELEKAGMDTHGRKIEVKIITAGYYDKDDGAMHELSDQDTAAFNKMVLSILGRSEETEREIERQQRMESNYKLVWKSGKKKKPAEPEDAH